MSIYNIYSDKSSAIFSAYCATSLTTQTLNSKISTKNVDVFISNYCSVHDIDNFRFQQEFNGTFTFKNNKCTDNESIILWELPGIKYRVTITPSTYDAIVNNAIIMLFINNICLKNNEELFFKCFVFACMMMIKTHHKIRTKSKTYYSDLKICDFILNCISNFLYRYESDANKLNEDIINTSISNTKANRHCTEYTTISNTLTSAEKRSNTNSIKNNKRDNIVISIYNEHTELSLRNIAKLYENNTGEKINAMAVKRILEKYVH